MSHADRAAVDSVERAPVCRLRRHSRRVRCSCRRAADWRRGVRAAPSGAETIINPSPDCLANERGSAGDSMLRPASEARVLNPAGSIARRAARAGE